MAFSKTLKIANKVLSAVATVTSVSIMAFSGYMIYENTYLQNRAFSSAYIQYKPELNEETVSVDELMSNIPDAVGWITMDDTHIDYPVVHGNDDLYYANRDIYQQPSLTGAIYLQAKNAGDFAESYNLLYGHHMDNGAMFGDLTKYLDQGFFSSHLTGTLVTSKEVLDVEVISVVETDAYEDAVYGITSLDWNGYTNNILNNNNIVVVNTNSAVKSAEKFLVLSTREGAATDGRILLICKLKETQKTVDPVVTQAPDEDHAGRAIVKTGDSQRYGSGWALLNLCCLILTIMTVIPCLMDMTDKKKEKTPGRFAGPIVGILLAIAALVIFITYENMTQPMVMKDKYTPWMLIILGIALVSEEFFARRKKNEEKEGEETADV